MITPDYAIEQVADCGAVPAAEWDALLSPEDFFLSSRWLGVAQATAGVPMRYQLLRRDGKLVAAVPTALAISTSPWVLGRPDCMLQVAAGAGISGAVELGASLKATGDVLPSLVSGGRHIGRTRVLTAPEATSEDIEALVQEIEMSATGLQARSVAFPFVDESDTALSRILHRRGYSSWVSGEYSDLPLVAPGFDSYLTRLTSKRRRSVLSERRHLRDAGVDVRIEELRPSLFPRFGELETELMGKYGISWSPELTINTLKRARSALGDDAVASVAIGDGDVRGFSLLLRFRDRWYARSAGFDYQWLAGLPLYFEVVYYSVIEAAAGVGVKSVHYGIGSEETKRSRGCVASVQRCFVLRLEGGSG